MRLRRGAMRLVPAVVLALALGGQRAAAASPPTAAASPPTKGALYTDGPDGRYLLSGRWLFRLDPTNTGRARGFASSRSTSGWTPVSVPNAWNATDQSAASAAGTIAWYRRDFTLPDRAAGLAWIVRFESVNFRARIWLNGHLLGSHVGAYLPFELALAGVRRTGVNRLVIKVDNRRSRQLATTVAAPQPPGGWWNYGGILREVYLRRVDRVDFSRVAVTPAIRCARCTATVTARALLRNLSSQPQLVHVAGRYGSAAIDLGTRQLAAGAEQTFTGALRVRDPRLWSPARPYLYKVRLLATVAGAGAGPSTAAGYTLLSGIRSIRVTRAGALLINDVPLHFRGVAIHEDNPVRGAALGNADRARIVGFVRNLGATVIRAHYPLHPELEELADRAGILLWSEIPAYQWSDQQLGERAFTDYAREQLTGDILANQNHPSVLVWSIANELSPLIGSAQSAYIAAQAALAKRLDPTRPVGIAAQMNPTTPCQAGYAPLGVLGFNDYFGWYTGPSGDIADRDELAPYLDTLRRCYPHQALAITEFGAEANRAGPVEERGTYAFQSDFVRFHLAAYAARPWLAGAIYFALQEFRIAPDWIGGDPWPLDPLHQKGLLSFAGVPKPAYYVVRGLYRATRQYGGGR